MHPGRSLMQFLFGLFPLLVLGAIVFGVVMAVRSSAGTEGREKIDIALALRSAIVHVGLFAAFVAVTVGGIGLLKLFVGADRLAGTNTDAARALSLLIVGIPAYGLLLRVVQRRYCERTAAGDAWPHRGWSVYLVAASTTTLVGSLVSVVQLTDKLTSSSQDFDSELLVQLLAWLAMWALHWFVLQPRFGVRGVLHLLIGSILGLGWMFVGSGAVIYRVLARGYDAAFDEPLAEDFDTTLWLVVAIAGAAVWFWYWHGHFNRVENRHRGSTLWFFTVVVAGVLPGLLAALLASVTIVSGLLIWFLGTVDEPAGEYFDTAPATLSILFVGFVSWAYHRWELQREGEAVRNEPVRFQDYAVIAVALAGVAVAVAGLVALLIHTASVDEGFAGSWEADNRLITWVTVLVASAGVWWRQWAMVERERALGPVAESESLWRKLYLVTAFGLGGMILGVSLIWLLFAVLRDLLDGELGRGTLEDLTRPVGWSVAVIGAVWYHVDIWRVDRATLSAGAGHDGGPPAPGARGLPAGVELRPAGARDAGELFTLQRAAFVDEAIAKGTLDVAPLRESFEELQQRLTSSRTIVAVEAGRIIAAVSAREPVDAHSDIDRLMVAPDRRGLGIEEALLREIRPASADQGPSAIPAEPVSG